MVEVIIPLLSILKPMFSKINTRKNGLKYFWILSGYLLQLHHETVFSFGKKKFLYSLLSCASILFSFVPKYFFLDSYLSLKLQSLVGKSGCLVCCIDFEVLVISKWCETVNHMIVVTHAVYQQIFNNFWQLLFRAFHKSEIYLP